MTLHATIKPLQRVQMAATRLGDALDTLPDTARTTGSMMTKRSARAAGDDMDAALYELRAIGDDASPTGFDPADALSVRAQSLVDSVRDQLAVDLHVLDTVTPHSSKSATSFGQLLERASNTSPAARGLSALAGTSENPVQDVRSSVEILKGMLDQAQIAQRQSAAQGQRSIAAHKAAGHIDAAAVDVPKSWSKPDPDAPPVTIGAGR